MTAAPRFRGNVRGNAGRVAALALSLIAIVGAARPTARSVAAPDLSQIKLTYTCGTFFRIRNANSSQVTLSYTVYRTSESGSVTLPAAPTPTYAYSETYLQTVNRGALRLTYNGQIVAMLDNGGIACSSNWKSGTWSNPVTWAASGGRSDGIVAIHAALLPDGRVMTYGRQVNNEPPQVWTPATDPNATQLQTRYAINDTAADLFCSGATLLSNGNLLVVGGNIGSASDSGRATAFVFNYQTNTWTRLPNMANARWYPTATALPDGTVLVHSGTINSTTWDTIPEVLQTNNTWRELSSAANSPGFYPWHFVAPNGNIFQAGLPSYSMWLSPSGNGSWSSGPRHVVDNGRDYGSAIMYDAGKILVVGGGQPSYGTQNTAEVIDLNGSAQWQQVGSLTYPRRQLSAVIMADGQVLVTGGAGGAGSNPSSPVALAAEVWNPHTQNFTVLSSMHHERLYHSNTLLLPDGRILSVGSGEPPASTAGSSGDGGVSGDTLNDQRNAEFFTPPYLYNPDGSLATASRPIVTSTPTSVTYGQVFTVQTANVAADTVMWIRLGAVTHAFNQSQRANYLAFTQSGGALSVTAPANANLAPPGPYVLFVWNGQHTPSVGRIIQIH